MATAYRIYRNAGGGPTEPIDYSAAIASGASSPIVLPALAAPGDYLIGIRSYDTVSGLEESNADGFLRLRIDASGVNISSLPNAVANVGADLVATDSVLISWAYPSLGEGGAPTGFKVWVTAGGSVDYGVAEDATIAYQAGRACYSATISGLSAGTSYAIGVRACNATGTEPGTVSVLVEVPASGPDPVEDLVGVATPIAR